MITPSRAIFFVFVIALDQFVMPVQARRKRNPGILATERDLQKGNIKLTRTHEPEFRAPKELLDVKLKTHAVKSPSDVMKSKSFPSLHMTLEERDKMFQLHGKDRANYIKELRSLKK